MRCTPKYHVVYHGTLREPGKPFEIAEEDADEMRHHGVVEDMPETAADVADQTAPSRRGRPRKNAM